MILYATVQSFNMFRRVYPHEHDYQTLFAYAEFQIRIRDLFFFSFLVAPYSAGTSRTASEGFFSSPKAATGFYLRMNACVVHLYHAKELHLLTPLILYLLMPLPIIPTSVHTLATCDASSSTPRKPGGGRTWTESSQRIPVVCVRTAVASWKFQKPWDRVVLAYERCV